MFIPLPGVPSSDLEDVYIHMCVCVCVCVCIQASLNRKLTRCNGLHFPLEMCTANDVMGEWGIIPVMMLLLLDV